ncbi:DinB family protein [Planococcus ruber]|uniref:DinB family protein n=1 Tax=Planococcus ruber TaxID=2027871 RepID=UPI001FEEF922|nr:DinB family protein [Planococcus ruber]MCJ1907651.1 DinB family protein [Planococcus ruber]
MSGIKLIQDFQKDLSKYSPEQLKYIPKEGVWSLGQMYDHIILVAHEYLDNVEVCAGLKEEQPLGKTAAGEQLFRAGGFPPVKIRLPDEMNAPPNNTDTKGELDSRLDALAERLASWEPKVNSIHPNLKVEHGGFGWLNAKEWYALVEMHSRHHLRQQKELEGYL